MKKITIIYPVLLSLPLFVFLGCATPGGPQKKTGPDTSGASREKARPRPPLWFTTPASLETAYPKSNFLIGVGSGSNGFDEADAKAIEEMARRFSVDVKGESTHVTSRKIETNGKQSAVFVVSKSVSGVKTRVNLTLEGIEIAKRASDTGGNFYSLAVLEREPAVRKLEGRIRKLQAGILALQKSATTLDEEGRIPEAVGKFLEAAKERKRLAMMIRKRRFIKDDASAFVPAPELRSSPELEDRAEKLLSGLEIVVESGDLQKAVAGEPLPEPLKVRAVIQRNGRPVPAKGVPLLFRYETGGGDLEGEQWTDDSGRVSNLVHKVRPEGEKLHRIAVAFDTDTMLANLDAAPERIKKWREHLDAGRRFVTYTIPMYLAPGKTATPGGWEDGILSLARQLVEKLDVNQKLTVTGVRFQELRSRERLPFSVLIESDLKRYLGSLSNISVLETPPEQKPSGQGTMVINGFYKKTPRRDVQITASLVDSHEVNLGWGKVVIQAGEIDPEDLKLMEEETAPVPEDQKETGEDAYQWTMEWLLALKHDNPGFDFKVWTDRDEYRICESNACDKVKISVKSVRPGYLYIFDIGTSGNLWMLFPNDRMRGTNYIEAGQTIRIPDDYWDTPIWVHGPQGMERVKAILTSRPVNWGALDKSGGFRHLRRDNSRGLRDLSNSLAGLSGDMAEATTTIFLRNKGARIQRGVRRLRRVGARIRRNLRRLHNQGGEIKRDLRRLHNKGGRLKRDLRRLHNKGGRLRRDLRRLHNKGGRVRRDMRRLNRGVRRLRRGGRRR